MNHDAKIHVERAFLDFTKDTKRQALAEAGNMCSTNGCHETKNLEYHHRLTLEDYLNDYSFLPAFIIRSLANCEVHCTYHHSLADKQSRKNANRIAAALHELAVNEGRLHNPED